MAAIQPITCIILLIDSQSYTLPLPTSPVNTGHTSLAFMQALDFKHQFGNYRWGQIIQIRHREFSS
jgi:hypothetical protein